MQQQNTKPILDKVSEYIVDKFYHIPTRNNIQENLEIPTVNPSEELQDIKNTLTKLRNTTNKLDYRDRMLIEAKREWENTFDSIHEFVVLIKPDKTIKRANIAFAKYMNLSIYDIVGKDFSECWNNLFTDKTVDEILTESQNIIHIKNNDKWLKTSLSYINNDDGTVDSYVLVLTDITSERKNLRIMNVIINDLCESIFRFDTTGVITFANNAFFKTFNIKDCDNLIGKNVNEIFSEQGSFLELITNNISKLSRDNLKTSFTSCIKHDPTTDIVLKVNIRVTYNGAPDPLEYLVVTEDISEICGKCKFYNNSV